MVYSRTIELALQMVSYRCYVNTETIPEEQHFAPIGAATQSQTKRRGLPGGEKRLPKGHTWPAGAVSVRREPQRIDDTTYCVHNTGGAPAHAWDRGRAKKGGRLGAVLYKY
jgi:hypothetical protein